MKDRFREFDGIRGVAILMVMGYHMIPPGESYFSNPLTKFLTALAQMGWAGVDLFFVLSGFLITNLLLEHKQKEHYFRNFYARRILRIFPVYYLSLTILFAAYFLAGKADIQSILTTGFWFYSYLHNWMYAVNTGPGLYFGHLWSLAIEEQFYLIWPLIVYFTDRKLLVRIGLGLMAVAFVLRVFIVFFLGNMEIINTFPYYSTITRIDSLILGALVSLAFQSASMKGKLAKDAPALLLMMSLLIGVCIATQPDSPLWNNRAMLTIGLSALAIFGGVLIIFLQTRPENNFLRVVFRNPVLTFFGKYSYALYIFHWPFTSLATALYGDKGYTGVGMWLFVVGGSYLCTIVAALISWNLVEKHALKLKRYFE